MMLNIEKSPQQNRFAEDFLFISIIWRLALICVCLISVVDVMFSQQNNNFLLSYCNLYSGCAIN